MKPQSLKQKIDYYIEFCHAELPTVWQRTYDYYNTIQDVKARINMFKTMDYMRDCECRIVQRTQTFEQIAD